MEWIIGIVTGLISGFVTGMLTCWYFYRRSGRELKQEAEKLRKHNILIISALEQAGLAKFSVDANGEPIGLLFKFQVSETVKLRDSATVEVLHNPQDKDQTGA